MSRPRDVIRIHIIFGVVAFVAALFLLSSLLFLDAPHALENRLTRNYIASFGVYIAIYVVSLVMTSSDSADASERSQYFWALSPIAGLLWIALAIGLLQLFCGGSFSCHR